MNNDYYSLLKCGRPYFATQGVVDGLGRVQESGGKNFGLLFFQIIFHNQCFFISFISKLSII